MLLCNAVFYKHARMEKQSHWERCLLRERPDQGTLDHFSFNSPLNVVCTVGTANCGQFINEETAKHVIFVHFFLAVQCHSDGCRHSLAHFLSPEFLHPLKLRALKWRDEQRIVPPTSFAQNCLFEDVARQLRFAAGSQCVWNTQGRNYFKFKLVCSTVFRNSTVLESSINKTNRSQLIDIEVGMTFTVARYWR